MIYVHNDNNNDNDIDNDKDNDNKIHLFKPNVIYTIDNKYCL